MATAGEVRGGGLTAEESALLEQLSGDVSRVYKSPLYGLGLLVVAIAMVLLPLIYVGLIAGIGWLVYLHAVHDVGILGIGGGARSRLVVYVAPLIIGPVVILFMLKPLFARPAKRWTSVSLPRSDEPLLHAYVERLSQLLRAPQPRTIDLDADVNASAGFRNGWLDWLTGSLTLTIGTPLVAGMTVRQLTGVLAHELGHFAQGFGMRLKYVIESINGWFARVVYERDAWDATLEGLADKNGSGYWQVLVGATRLMVWLTRRILWVLMFVGRAISCFMSRRMEYDADLCEARVAGSDAFAGIFSRLHLLGFAHHAAHGTLEAGWRERRLADDLAALTLSVASSLPEEAQEAIASGPTRTKSGWFATHPATADRIQAAERAAAPGILHDKRPATSLFRDFRRWSRAATLEYYQQGLGLEVDQGNLASAAGMVAEQQRESQAARQLETYLGHPLSLTRPIRVSDGDFTRAATAKELAAHLGEAQRGIAARREAAEKAHAAYAQASDRIQQLDFAAHLVRFGLKLDPAEFKLATVTPAAIEAARSAATREQVQALEILRPYDGLLEQRLVSALRLLKAKGIERYVPAAEALAAEAVHLAAVLSKVVPIVDAFNLRTADHVALRASLGMLDVDKTNDAAGGAVNACVTVYAALIREQRRTVYNVPYPFTHASGDVSIGNYLFPDGDVSAPEDVIGSVFRAMENLGALYRRLIARLVEIACEVEAGLAAAKAAAHPHA